VRVETSVDALSFATRQRFGRLDLLFNNAGTGAPKIPIEDLSLAQWDDVVEVNLSGAFLCARAAFRLMKEQRPRGGRIINNGSLSAHAPRPMSAPYSSSREEPTMDVRHVADAVVHMASLPLSTNVQFLTLMAAKMPFIGRG
jgi:NAD(P)-dependent dehydrogenase (short-subunit alcohol dehydrogenase family)